jgi:hypothetical protein
MYDHITKPAEHQSIMVFKTAIVAFAIFISLSGCKKSSDENLFSNITTLDCRNLLIRNIALKDSIINVTLENTCKNCEDNWIYLGMVVIDRTRKDTLARTYATCLSCPKNRTSATYQLYTNLKGLPDLKTVRFDFGYLCTDITYMPNK